MHVTPVREKLLRRLQQRRICGVVLSDGRSCLASPLPGLQTCRSCTPRKVREAANEKPASVLLDVLKGSMRDEDAAAVEEFLTHGPCTLEDLIAVHRLRLAQLERRFADGLITLAQYGSELRQCTETIRKLTIDNSKLQLNEALANRFSTDDEEAFNPFAHLPLPGQGAGTGGAE